MYGTNDYFASLRCDTYARVLKCLVERRQEAGAKVMIIPPPPLLEDSHDYSIEPFRAAARDVAARTGAAVCEISDALSRVPEPFYDDGIHLTSAAYQAIGVQVARMIKVNETAPAI